MGTGPGSRPPGPLDLPAAPGGRARHSGRRAGPGWGPRSRATTGAHLGEERSVRCRLTGADPAEWSLFPLPPAGWGVVPGAREIAFDAGGEAAFPLAARRPHRIRGEAWPLLLVAVGPGGHQFARGSLEVPDSEPGRLLVTVTEDHEIHEERGKLPVDMLRRLLVEKSRFAAELGVPWTHMVEAGSTLAMPDRAAGERGGAWQGLRSQVRRHLAEETQRGHDLQPHLTCLQRSPVRSISLQPKRRCLAPQSAFPAHRRRAARRLGLCLSPSGPPPGRDPGPPGERRAGGGEDRRGGPSWRSRLSGRAVAQRAATCRSPVRRWPPLPPRFLTPAGRSRLRPTPEDRCSSCRSPPTWKAII